jgi:hypothetical protein
LTALPGAGLLLLLGISGLLPRTVLLLVGLLLLRLLLSLLLRLLRIRLLRVLRIIGHKTSPEWFVAPRRSKHSHYVNVRINGYIIRTAQRIRPFPNPSQVLAANSRFERLVFNGGAFPEES